MLENFLIENEFGFVESEIAAIENRFFCTLDFDDWESMEILGEVQEDDDNFLNLPTGRLVYFPDVLVRKDILSQID